MERCKLTEVNERIREAAQQAAAVDGLSVPVVERFLRTGDETWDGAGSGRFTLAQFKEDEAYTRAAKAGLRTCCTSWRVFFRPKLNQHQRWPQT